MSYKRTSIKKIIADIDQNKVYLPALQRKFVWGKPQIQLFFDSIMRNYPVGTFLFWRLNKKNADNYVFYEFLKEYDQRSPYNRRKTGPFLHEEITGVLDGQQRLSSMYIGMMGTHTEKAPYKHVANDAAYEKMSLYINLLSLPYSVDEQNKITIIEDKNFEFKFLTDSYVSSRALRKLTHIDSAGKETEIEEPMFWLKVGDALGWDEDLECDPLLDAFVGKCTSDAQKSAIQNNKRLIRKFLETLHGRINKEELLSYFEVAKEELEDILKIFIRVNSGGTPLNMTDLLFSTIVATWDDGREKIELLLKTINSKGDKFDFSNEYLMRCCLVLTDAPVLYKVNSFKSENVQKIRDEWPAIATAVGKTVDLLVEFGFSGSLLTSQNATIIIAYYLYKGGVLDQDSKRNIRKYLIHALLNNIYGTSQEQLIGALRNAFREPVKSGNDVSTSGKRFSSFSFDEVLKIELPGKKSLSVTETDIDRFLSYKKGATSFFVLSLLYPNLRYQDVQFHQDHIHPAADFNHKKFGEMSIPGEQWAEWLNLRDCVPNLQLLEGRRNESKNATALAQWLEKMADKEKASFIDNNYIPTSVGLGFSEFLTFFEQRRTRLKTKLMEVLAVDHGLAAPEQEVWIEEEETETKMLLAEVGVEE